MNGSETQGFEVPQLEMIDVASNDVIATGCDVVGIQYEGRIEQFYAKTDLPIASAWLAQEVCVAGGVNFFVFIAELCRVGFSLSPFESDIGRTVKPIPSVDGHGSCSLFHFDEKFAGLAYLKDSGTFLIVTI